MNNKSPDSPRGIHHVAPSCRKTGSEYKGVCNDCKGAENVPSNRGKHLGVVWKLQPQLVFQVFKFKTHSLL